MSERTNYQQCACSNQLVYRIKCVVQLKDKQNFVPDIGIMHCMHTQIIINNRKVIHFVKSGFLGHANNAQTYNRMDNIGPSSDLDFPVECYLLADKAYPNGHPLMTPYTAVQVRRQPRGMHRKWRTPFTLCILNYLM